MATYKRIKVIIQVNILYIGYWSIADGLSVATIKPHLNILSQTKEVSTIVYVSIERSNKNVSFDWNIDHVLHFPFYSPYRSLFLDKLYDLTELPKQLAKLCHERNIEKIICRGAPAGSIGYLLWRKIGLPYYVESFEPHAEYMREGNVWKFWDLRYLMQKFFENRQKKTASALFTVSNNYKKYLVENEKVIPSVKTVPCSVDIEQFKFSKHARTSIRSKYGLNDSIIVGVYVGKFGDIYYENETLRLFNRLLEYVEHFFLFILTPQSPEFLEKKLSQFGLSSEKCWYGTVPHNQVADYLSASDMAFCPVKSTPSRKYCSPIKNGEYWANGLPIIISEGIGDDSDIIRKHGEGMIVNFEVDVQRKQIDQLLSLIARTNQDRLNNQNVINAREFRSVNEAIDAYQYIIYDR